MGIFDGWLICTDFDGTIYCDGDISAENCAAVACFQKQGGRFTFASGRNRGTFEGFSQRIRANAPLILLNGALIEDAETGEPLYRGGLEKEPSLCFALDIFAQEQGITGLTVYAEDASYTFCRDKKVDLSAFAAGLPGKFDKMIFDVTEADSDRLLSQIRDRAEEHYSISRSWEKGIEINDFADNKGTAALRVKEIIGARHLVCVGNYDNDVDMIRVADIGYAVGDSSHALLAVADRVTVPGRSGAIACIVRELGEMIEKAKPQPYERG